MKRVKCIIKKVGKGLFNGTQEYKWIMRLNRHIIDSYLNPLKISVLAWERRANLALEAKNGHEKVVFN